MKIPLSWLSEYVAIDASAEEIARRLSMAGLVVESIEKTAPAFSGVVTARVVHAEKHPNADRLRLCDVDAGARGRFKVVCGAPNARAGIHVALAMVGARLAGEGSLESAAPLGAAVIRGIESNGMLCSERELGLSNEHAGILELDSHAPLGVDFAQWLQTADTVLDVEITPNRGDCLSIVGIAREVAALFGLKMRRPNPRMPKLAGDPINFAVRIDAPDLCPRYAAVAMRGIKIARSPILVRQRLERCGMRGVNNVVDATNYVMLEYGQPIHAFDFAKIAGGQIVVRRAGGDRSFVTLDNVTRALDADDLLIADGDKALAIAGVMGGLNSEVAATTETILLESAYFNPATIGRTGRRLGLPSEARHRFERGIDRAGQVVALARVAELIARSAHGKVASNVVDIEPQAETPREIALDLDAMAALLGTTIPPAIVKSRLKSIQCSVASRGRRSFVVVPPSFRSDLNESADLAEEVARLGLMEDIPAAIPMRVGARTPRSPEREFSRAVREVMMGAGFDEARTLAFIAPTENLRFAGVRGAGSRALKVENPLSAELGEMRLSIVPGLLGSLRFNLNRQASTFHAFETGRTYGRDGDRAVERATMAALSFGRYAMESIGARAVEAGFYTIKGALEAMFEALGASGNIVWKKIDPARYPFLHPARSAEILIAGESELPITIGFAGELHPAIALEMELTHACAVCELDLENLITYGHSPRKAVEIAPRFPAIRRDLALVLDREVEAAMVLGTIREIAPPLLESVEVFDVYEGAAIGSGRKSVALALRYRAKDRTLTDEEVNRLHALVVEQARARLGAELRS
jgi:phenylalanyl-tRNA synthetase beta chain